MIAKDHIIIDMKNNKFPFEKWIKDKNRQFTEETNSNIYMEKYSVAVVNEIQIKFKENLRLVCFCLPNLQRIWKGKILLNGGKMSSFSNHCWW